MRDRKEGKVADITGPGITDRWGVTCADLGASVIAPNGTLVSVFGDTFSGNRVGEGDWRSPVILIGSGDASHPIAYHRAGGGNPGFAQQLWRYTHRTGRSGRPRRGISTVIPPDLLRVGESLYLHAIVNRGFGNVVWTEIWRSDDSGMSWHHLGAKFPAGLHNGYAQSWSWDYDPVDGWIYIVSTGFQRDKGIILQRVRPEHIADPRKYSGWGRTRGLWSWGKTPTPLTPPGETWGELSLRRLAEGMDSRRIPVLGIRAWVPGDEIPHRCAYRATAASDSRIRLGRRRPCRQPGRAALRRIPPAGFEARRDRWRRPGGIAVEHHTRMALSGNASPRDGARHHQIVTCRR
jgi:hypothetical protein